jgi:hypothetical protein
VVLRLFSSPPCDRMTVGRIWGHMPLVTAKNRNEVDHPFVVLHNRLARKHRITALMADYGTVDASFAPASGNEQTSLAVPTGGGTDHFAASNSGVDVAGITSDASALFARVVGNVVEQASMIDGSWVKCVFRAKPITDSDASRSPIPRHADRGFRGCRSPGGSDPTCGQDLGTRQPGLKMPKTKRNVARLLAEAGSQELGMDAHPGEALELRERQPSRSCSDRAGGVDMDLRDRVLVPVCVAGLFQPVVVDLGEEGLPLPPEQIDCDVADSVSGAQSLVKQVNLAAPFVIAVARPLDDVPCRPGDSLVDLLALLLVEILLALQLAALARRIRKRWRRRSQATVLGAGRPGPCRRPYRGGVDAGGPFLPVGDQSTEPPNSNQTWIEPREYAWLARLCQQVGRSSQNASSKTLAQFPPGLASFRS